jgi:diaminohydroxyphosphoribosylaminopyrimidine deaminase / 5-amino-6-(5-phosphoribosylamino)uracil reductase
LTDARDALRMDEALSLARRGWGQTAPNPLVGAVLYKGDEKIAEGFHARFGEAHAEASAIASAGDRARGSTLYVTLEPCAHHGKTPPCADAIIDAGVSRVVAATSDPTPVAGGGADRLRSAGITVDIGIREREARELNAAFFNATKSDRPWVTLKLALSLDGAISGAKRLGGWLTGTESRAEVQRMRAASDAIAIGVLTAIADNPQLTARTTPPPRVQPVRIVFDRSARLSSQNILVKTAREVRTLVVTTPSTRLPADLAHAGVEQIAATDVHDALRQLKERGVLSLMVEGGAGLAASFLAGDHVDRLVIFRAPVILGAAALGAFSGIASQEIEHAPRYTLLETRALGDDVMSVYRVGAR